MMWTQLGIIALCAVGIFALAGASDAVAEEAQLAPASPAQWELPAHLVPHSVDPRDIVDMAASVGVSVPIPCRVERSRDASGPFETLTREFDGDTLVTSLENTLSGLSVRIETARTVDKKGRLKKSVETTSEGDKDTCSFKYDGQGRLTKEKCSHSCRAFRYDKKGRLTQTLESRGTCGDWQSFVGYGYEAASALPTSVRYCSDKKMKECFATVHVQLDDQGRSAGISVEEEGSTVASAAFTYDARGLLVGVSEAKGSTEIVATEVLTYDKAGERLLSVVRERTNMPTSTTTYHYSCE